jgi:hypothetical protein
MLDIVSNVAPLKPTDTTSRQLSWFAERVEKGKVEPFVEIVAITPEVAKRMLELNDGNRPLNERLLAEISADIEAGRWALNGETIIISKEGLLNDGQHRLEAVIRTQTTIQSAVMFGVEREARMTVDMGRQRTAGNFLAMTGATHSNHAAAIAKLLILFEKGKYSPSNGAAKDKLGTPTKQEIRRYYQIHRKRIIAAIDALAHEKFTRTVGLTPLAAAYVILTKLNLEEAAVFFARVLDGTSLKPHDSILWLRARFVAEQKKRLNPHEKLELILRHWNRWRSGSKVSRHITREGVYPVVQK